MSESIRRGNKDIDRYLEPYEVYELIISAIQPEGRNPDLVVRNRALIAALFITCARISEILRITKGQFVRGSDYVKMRDYLRGIIERPESWLILKNFRVSKRKAKTIRAFGQKLLDIPIPLFGNHTWQEITPISGLLVEHLDRVDSGARIFPFSRSHAWRIVSDSTGLWDHFFRAQGLSYYVNKLGNPLAVGQIFGIENVNTLKWYYKGAWARYMA